MTVKLLPASPEDAASMLEVGMAAFRNDDLMNTQFCARSSTAEQLDEFKKWRTELFHARMSGPGKRYIKAVDNSTVLGYVGLNAPHSHVASESDISLPKPAHLNFEAMEELRVKVKAVKEKHVADPDDTWYVQQMVVHPDFQGRGVAKQLLLKGLEQADRDRKDVWLDATPSGKRLYERCGFEVVEEIPLDTVPSYSMFAMIRRPQKSCESES